MATAVGFDQPKTSEVVRTDARKAFCLTIRHEAGTGLSCLGTTAKMTE